jgi:hypothetical protein
MGQPKPWEAIGISRATWYRHGKPTEKPKRTSIARAARAMGASSTRTFQRINRVLAADMDLALLMLQHGWCKPGQAEAIIRDPVLHRKFRKLLRKRSPRI